MLPLFTASIKGGSGDLEALAKKAYSVLFFFGAGIALFLAVAAKPAIAFIANPEYLVTGPSGYDSSHAMRIVAFVFFFYFLSSLFTYLLIAAGRQKRLLKINAFVAVANLVGNLVAIPTYSFVGSAAVTLASQILLLFLTAHAAKPVLEKRFFIRETVGITALSAVCVVFAWAALEFSAPYGSTASLFVAAAAFGIPYLGGGWWMRKYSRISS